MSLVQRHKEIIDPGSVLDCGSPLPLFASPPEIERVGLGDLRRPIKLIAFR